MLSWMMGVISPNESTGCLQMKPLNSRADSEPYPIIFTKKVFSLVCIMISVQTFALVRQLEHADLKMWMRRLTWTGELIS